MLSRIGECELEKSELGIMSHNLGIPGCYPVETYSMRSLKIPSFTIQKKIPRANTRLK